jgi:hypothetical protein
VHTRHNPLYVVLQMKRKQDGQAQDDSDSEDAPKPSAPKKAKAAKVQAKPSGKTPKKGEKFISHLIGTVTAMLYSDLVRTCLIRLKQ